VYSAIGFVDTQVLTAFNIFGCWLSWLSGQKPTETDGHEEAVLEQHVSTRGSTANPKSLLTASWCAVGGDFISSAARHAHITHITRITHITYITVNLTPVKVQNPGPKGHEEDLDRHRS
jgi:hypothetical protein